MPTIFESPKSNWLTASLIGFILVGMMFHFPSGFPPINDNEFNGDAFFGGAMQGILSGIVVGFLQWLVLRRRRVGASRWVLWTAIGLGIVHAFGDSLPDPVAIPVVSIFGGVVLGATQWFALRPAFDKAWLWIVTAGIGWAIGMAIGLTLTNAMGLRNQAWTPQVGATEHGLVGLAVGLGYGIATGLLLPRTAPTLDSPA